MFLYFVTIKFCLNLCLAQFVFLYLIFVFQFKFDFVIVCFDLCVLWNSFWFCSFCPCDILLLIFVLFGVVFLLLGGVGVVTK
jgi:hypothetical protein